VLHKLSMGWLLVPLALVVTFGGVAHLTPWILGPAKGVAGVGAGGRAPGPALGGRGAAGPGTGPAGSHEPQRRTRRAAGDPGRRRLGVRTAVPVRPERQHLVLDALGGDRADHHRDVRADVRRRDPAPSHPARQAAPVPDPGRAPR